MSWRAVVSQFTPCADAETTKQLFGVQSHVAALHWCLWWSHDDTVIMGQTSLCAVQLSSFQEPLFTQEETHWACLGFKAKITEYRTQRNKSKCCIYMNQSEGFSYSLVKCTHFERCMRSRSHRKQHRASVFRGKLEAIYQFLFFAL